MSVDTVNDIDPSVQYTASAAQTNFDYPFPIFTDADLVVDVDGVTQALTTDYTVAGEGDDTGGTVTFLVAMTGGEIVTIYRDLPIERLTDFQQNGRFATASFNDELDKIIMIQQQLDARINRALRLSRVDAVSDADMELPAPASRAGKFLYFNAITGAPEMATGAVAGTVLSASTVGDVLHDDAWDIIAGVTATHPEFPQFDARRYGCSASATAATNVTAINNASLVAYTAGGAFVELPEGTISFNANLLMRDGVKFRGQGTEATKLSYTGSAKAFVSNTTGTRTYDQGIRDLTIIDAGTGTMGIDLDSISTSHFENLIITGFDVGVRVYSPTNGYSVYDRFTNVTANGCTKGFQLAGVGSNATRFQNCRYNGSTQVGTTAFEFIDANGCSVVDCDIDVVENAFVLTAPSGAGYADSNIFRGNRVEACTLVYNLGANVRYTHILDNAYTNITTLITDSGTRNNISDPPYRLHADYADTSTANGQVRLHRSVTGGASLPFMVVRDSVNSDTPITLQIETERSVGSFLRAQRGASTYLEAYATGALGIRDGITAPAAVSGQAILFVDTADGDLKVIFGDGTTKTIVVDT